MNEEPAAVRAVVRGRVQGVGFRDFVCHEAAALSLTGYVRNLPERREVEVLAEGPREVLEQLIERLYEGPSASRVERVEVDWREAGGRHQRFDITF
jgi:acylphosphatase